jgi:hypothetical protein
MQGAKLASEHACYERSNTIDGVSQAPSSPWAAISLHETPLCRIGNGGKYVCDPDW